MSIGERVEEWVEARRLAVGLALGGLILVGIGVAWWRMPIDERSEVEVLSATVASESGQIVVDVAGAVARPGVYSLGSGARVAQALALAGGLVGEADGEWVAKYLNQADKVRDGMKIYIPSKSQVSNPKFQTSTNDQVSSPKININIASQGELESLPGVGPVTAGKMIAGRPYGRVEELVERKMVGQKVWEQIKGMIAVW